MRFLLILILVIFNVQEVFAASELSAKRSELISLYEQNLDKIWNVSEVYPPDFYLSSLAISLASGNKSIDAALSSKIDQASASVFFMAAITSLKMSAELFKNLSVCNAMVESKSKSADGLCQSKETDATKNLIEIQACKIYNLSCKKSLEFYFDRRNAWNGHMKTIHLPDHNYDLWHESSLPYFISDFLQDVRTRCADGSSPWAKNLSIELHKSCLSIDRSVIKNDNVFLPERPFKEVPLPGGFDHKQLIDQNLVYQVQYPKMPLIFASGQKLGVGYYLNPLFQGIFVPKTFSALKLKHLFLIGPQLRAFYWLEMAEELYERAKSKDLAGVKNVLDPSALDKLGFKISGNALCISPILENKFCSDYSLKFMDSIKGRSYLNTQLLSFEDSNILGRSYNLKPNITLAEIRALQHLADDLEKNRREANILKSEVQQLIYRAESGFSFEAEKNAL